MILVHVSLLVFGPRPTATNLPNVLGGNGLARLRPRVPLLLASLMSQVHTSKGTDDQALTRLFCASWLPALGVCLVLPSCAARLVLSLLAGATSVSSETAHVIRLRPDLQWSCGSMSRAVVDWPRPVKLS